MTEQMAEQANPPNKHIMKVSLPKITEGINRTLEAYEDGVYDDEALDVILGNLMVDLRNSVDRRIAFLDYLGGQSQGSKPGSGVIGKAQELYRAYREKMEIAERLKERVQQNTLKIVETNKDIKFEGNLGKLAAQANPGKLVVDFHLGSASMSNVIDPHSDTMLNVPSEYVKAVTVLQLDTEKLKTDLKNGAELSWARLEKGNHLRVRR